MSTYHPKQYKTKNWPTYNRSLIARGSITLLFDETMQWYGQRQGKRGKPQRFSEAAIQFCLSIKVLFRLPLRPCTGFVGSLLKLARLDWAVPDYTTLCPRQEQLNVRISYTPSREGLHLLVDSTSIKFLGEGEWKRKKHGVGYRRQWRKVHLGIDAKTLQIRAIAVTDSSIGDSSALPEIIGQIPEAEMIATVTGDGAFDTRNCWSQGKK
jgi:hypothetical protein